MGKLVGRIRNWGDSIYVTYVIKNDLPSIILPVRLSIQKPQLFQFTRARMGIGDKTQF